MKTITPYFPDGDFALDVAALVAVCENGMFAANPPAGNTVETRGFVPVYENGPLTLRSGTFMTFSVKQSKRLLPASVIRDLAEEKAIAFEEQRGFKPGRKLMKELKEQAAMELIPNAYIVSKVIRVIVDTATGRMFFGCSPGAAEDWLAWLRDHELSLAMLPLGSARGPDMSSLASSMTSWIFNMGNIGQNLSLGDGVALRGEHDSIRYRGHDLLAPEIRVQLEAGRHVESVAVVLDGVARFTIDSSGCLKAFALEDAEEDGVDNDGSDPDTAAAADLLIMGTSINGSATALLAA